MVATSEKQLSEAVLKVANGKSDGIATFDDCYEVIPTLITLSPEDIAPSTTRKGEPMWKQRVRNIKSHDKVENNFIEQGLLTHIPHLGYKITSAGKKHLS